MIGEVEIVGKTKDRTDKKEIEKGEEAKGMKRRYSSREKRRENSEKKKERKERVKRAKE